MKLGNFFGFAVGPFGSALVGLITVPVAAWLFAPADLGRLNVFQVFISFTMILTVLGMDQSYLREFHEARDRSRLFLSCFLPGFILLALLGLSTLPFSSQLASMLYGISSPALFLLTTAGAFASFVTRFLSLILRMQERGWAYSASQVLPKMLALLLLLCVPMTAIDPDFLLLQGIMVAGLLGVMLVFVWNTRSDWRAALRSRLHGAEVRRLASFGMPLLFSGLAYWALSATSTLSLRRWSTLEELAIYSVTNSFAGAAVVFQSIFATIWSPTVYRWVAEGVDMQRVDSVIRHALVVVCIVFIGIGLFSWVVDYFLPEHYVAVKFLLACALAPSLLYTLSIPTGVGINISRRTGWSVAITIAALLTNIALSWWLVPRKGAAGAVLANSAAFFVFFALKTEVSAAVWRKIPRAKLYVVLVMMLAVAAAIAANAPQLPAYFSLIWFVPLAGASILLRREVFDLFHLGLRRIRRA